MYGHMGAETHFLRGEGLGGVARGGEGRTPFSRSMSPFIHTQRGSNLFAEHESARR